MDVDKQNHSRLISRWKLAAVVSFFSFMIASCSFNLFDANSFSVNNDYSSQSCDSIWFLQDKAVVNDPTYWLAIINCVRSMSFDRQLVINRLRLDQNEKWHSLFKQSMVFERFSIPLNQRQRWTDKLKKEIWPLPQDIRTLVTLWIEGQEAQFALAAANSEYQQLKGLTTKQYDQLKKELRTVELKLKRLTDIERQLSTQKPVTDNQTTVKVNTADIHPTKPSATDLDKSKEPK